MATIWSEDFESSPNNTTADAAYNTSSTSSVSYFPQNWVKFSDLTNEVNGMTIGYAWNEQLCGPGEAAATWGSQRHGLYQRSRGWVIGTGATGSGSTGPNGGYTAGGGSHDANGKYLLLEATSQGSSSYTDSNRKRGLHLIRTESIDLTSYSANDVITLYGKFHAYGAYIGALGIACTTHATKAGATYEAFTGSGFTGYTNDSGNGLGGGGLDIDYEAGSTGSIGTFNKKRIIAQQHSSNSDAYSEFEADLTGAGGQTVYLYFLYESLGYDTYQWNTSNTVGNDYYKADFAIDYLAIKDSVVPDTDYKGKIYGLAGSTISNIYGKDLDEDDKIYTTDGEGGDPPYSLTVVGTWDSSAQFYGNVMLRMRTSMGNWVSVGTESFTSSSTFGTLTFTPDPSVEWWTGSNNFSMRWYTIPLGGNFTSSAFTVTNTGSSNLALTTTTIGTSHYHLGTWTVGGSSELEVEWEDTV